ncbi:hypothetical protein C2W59_02003 [Bacillus pumilus]|nr:hypothetical protein C2W59_02003 [Bacillus pumilus]
MPDPIDLIYSLILQIHTHIVSMKQGLTVLDHLRKLLC